MRNVGVRTNPGDIANQQDIARWSFGTGNPSDAAGAQGDYYVGSDNKLWSKGATTWTYTGVQYGSSAAVPEKTVPVDADILSLGDSANGLQMRKLTWGNMRAALPFREKLTAARTYYVRTDGNDSNTGLANTSAGAFLTIQKAIDTAAGFDLNGYTVTIQVGAGTYTGNITCKGTFGNGLVQLIGNTSTPANVVLTASSGGIVTLDNTPARYRFAGFRMQGSSAIGFISSGTNCKITAENIEYGPLTYGAFAYVKGEVDLGTCTINGSMSMFALSIGQATLTVQVGITITLSGTPNFSAQFIQADRLSFLQIYGVTFSGSATGKRYAVDGNSEVFVNGAGASYLPGNTAGTVANGGLYV